MKFPAGTDGGTVSSLQDETFIRQLMFFIGAIEIRTGSGHGFILTENGKLIAAYFRSPDSAFKGKAAISRMTTDSGGSGEQTFRLRKYTPSEFSLAVRISGEEHLLIVDPVPAPAGPETATPSPAPAEREAVAPPPAPEPAVKAGPAAPVLPEHLDETRLRKILSQPGVIAVSAFFEGFPVQSIGEGDFEHVAASAEDFMRAGTKIAQEMKIGDLNQLILETAQNKFIIAPCGDLYLCILTAADAQLGLIRVVLKSIQKEIAGQ
jgi:predicted regulator of Ras-like GTPase activity (Roadblock/LC7/MglB family)